MAIWGHETVRVEKDVEKREWRVLTAKAPHQLLVTVPWTDAFRTFKHAPDYSEAIATCQSHENTALTEKEEREVLWEIEHPGEAAAKAQAKAQAKAREKEEALKAPNVLEIDFKAKRRK